MQFEVMINSIQPLNEDLNWIRFELNESSCASESMENLKEGRSGTD